MHKRRLAFMLGFGPVLALAVSACGVAMGPVQFTADGGAVLNPALSVLHVPGLSGTAQPAVMGSIRHLQVLRINNQARTLDTFGRGSCHLEP